MRLYEEDAFCQEFVSRVITCQPQEWAGESCYAIELENTAFYPEGGGQPCDLGVLNEVTVRHVMKKDGKVIHLCSDALPVDGAVCGKIDWQRRFDLMQQHSGEHLVSGIAHELFSCDNVGFHMGKDFITIDLNVLLTTGQLNQLEEKVNQYIWENHPVEISYPDPQQREALAYRSKKELAGAVRIVTFPLGDCCACCGTHVSSSGQIGLVKLLSAQKFREGVRIELLCGGRAMAYFSQIREENLKISNLLSAKPLETASAVERLLKEKEKQDISLAEMEKKEIALYIQEHGGESLLFLENLSLDAVRMVASGLAKTTTDVVCCFLQENDGFRYAIAVSQGDVRNFVKALNEKFSGRGGGKANLAQGSLVGERKEIEEFTKNFFQA